MWRHEQKWEHASHPEYHGPYHFSDVVAQTIEFLKKNNELAANNVWGAVMLSPQEPRYRYRCRSWTRYRTPWRKELIARREAGNRPIPLGKEVSGDRRTATQSCRYSARIDRENESGDPRHQPRHECVSANPLREISRLDKAGQPIEWQKLPDHESFFDLKLLAEDPAARLPFPDAEGSRYRPVVFVRDEIQ